MKILQIIPSFYIGGAEVMCKTLSIELKKMGHDIEVISLYSMKSYLIDELNNNQITVHFLNKKRGLDLSIKNKIRKIILQFNPQVIQTHLDVNKYVPFTKKEIIRVHTVHNIAEKEANLIDKFLNTYFFKKHKIIPISLSVEIQKSIINLYRLNPKDVPIIFNGVPLDKCLKKENYFYKEHFDLINVAQFRPQKNHFNLINGFEMALTKKSNLHLTLVGEGELFERIKQLVLTKKLKNSIDFIGNVDNVYQLLGTADCFILPSYYEGMPISIIEAMGSALPVIASNVGGIPNMITHKETGFICDTTAEGICNSILEIVDNEELRKKIGNNACALAQKKYSSLAMAKEYVKIYEKQVFKNNE